MPFFVTYNLNYAALHLLGKYTVPPLHNIAIYTSAAINNYSTTPVVVAAAVVATATAQVLYDDRERAAAAATTAAAPPPRKKALLRRSRAARYTCQSLSGGDIMRPAVGQGLRANYITDLLTAG